MNEKHKYQVNTAPEVTLMANTYPGATRTFPAKGLTIDQMVTALVQMNYSPVVYSKASAPRPLKEIVYYYLESSLPVILALRVRGVGHTCLVIGHDYRPEDPWTSEGSLVKNSDLIQHYVVHDDELGPYLHLPLVAGDVKNSSFWEDRDPSIFRQSYTTPYSFDDVFAVIVPIHKKIYLQGEELTSQVEAFFSAEQHLLQIMFGCMEDEKRNLIEGLIEHNELAVRTFFIQSNEYKQRIAELQGVSETLREFYLNAELPRFIWLTEISSVDYITKPDNDDHLILGEIISDSTTDPQLPCFFMFFHLPGILLEVNPNNSEAGALGEIHKVKDDEPYQAYIREYGVERNEAFGADNG